MTATYKFQIECDWCSLVLDAKCVSIFEIRAEAFRHGWRQHEDEDLCSDCGRDMLEEIEGQ